MSTGNWSNSNDDGVVSPANNNVVMFNETKAGQFRNQLIQLSSNINDVHVSQSQSFAS